MIPVPKVAPIPKINRISSKDFLKGVVTSLDDGRTPIDGLRATANTILDQDGTIRPRPSLIRYGTQPVGTIMGEMYEFVRVNGSVNETWLISLQKVDGVASIYTAKDGGSWNIITGKTYDSNALAHFCQIDNKVLITNGVDYLSYYDIPTATIIPFVAVATPAAPTAVVAPGLTGTTYNVYYLISANSTVGETAASAAVTVPVSTDRDYWISSTQFVTLSWTAVTGAKSYNVYLATVNPGSGGTAYLVAAGLSATTYKDDGSAVKDVSRPSPAGDSTSGPRVTRASVIGSQVFLVGDADNPDYVWFGGTGKSVLDFSPFDGGGNISVGQGGKEFPVKVVSFRDGKGNSVTTVLCRGTNGTGKRYLLNPQSITIGSSTATFFSATEDNGQDGTDSPDAVIIYRDSIWYPSRDGFKTTGTKPQLQNILSTDTVSETIITDIAGLNNIAMAGAVGLPYQGRLYFALPNGTTSNNEIWTLDLNRGGAWMKPWGIKASWMTLYNSNDGQTHHLIISNNVIYELSYVQAANDDGVPFATNITSGLIHFSDDTLEWAKVIDVNFVLLRPQGTININVAGKTEDSDLVSLGAVSYVSTANSTVAGWGEAGWAGSGSAVQPVIFGWSNFGVIPQSFNDAQTLVTVEVDETCNYIQYEIDTDTIGTDFQLGNVIVRSVDVGVIDLD